MNDILRINLELQRMDNPALYDDLAAFPKGPRRVNRLRTLAHEGLLCQRNPAAPGQSVTTVAGGGSSASDAVDQLFGGPHS